MCPAPGARGPVEQAHLLERGGARWKTVKTVPHRFDAAERGATSETAIVLDCRLLYSADVRGSRAGQKMRCQLTRVASQLHSGPSVLDLAGRKSESRRGGGLHVLMPARIAHTQMVY